MIELLKTLFSEFNSKNHPVIFIRPKALAEPDIFEGDFDFLLHPNDVEYFVGLIHQACTRYKHSFVVKTKRLDKFEVLIFTHDCLKHVKMDVWTELDIKAPGVRKGSAILFEKLLENRCINFDGSGPPSLEGDFEATYYLSHLLSKSKDLNSEGVINRLEYYKNLKGVKAETLDWLNNPSVESSLKANQKLNDSNLISFELSNRLRKVLFRFKQDIRNKRKIIAIVGPDGVGKTTVIEIISVLLNGKYFRFKKLFRKSFIYDLLFFLTKNPLEKKLGHKLAKNQFDDLQGLKLFWIALLGGYIRGFSLGFGKLKLIDRYYPDLLVSGSRFQGGETRQYTHSKRLARLCPTPCAYVQIDAPDEVILSRKTELSADAIQHLRNDYLELGYQIGSPFYVYINNSYSLDSIKSLFENLRL